MAKVDEKVNKAVVSTRVRLARNIVGYPFPNKLKSETQAKEIIRLVNTELNRLDPFNLYFMSSIKPEIAEYLKEKYLISSDLINNKKYSAVLINNEENTSIMINEEDHLREQYILKGFDLLKAYENLSGIDDTLSKNINFAYDNELGFLTACPTNLGTGLRASVMLFLPAITLSKSISELIRRISRLGLTVRGVYGEGSEAEGYMYQISNEVTLGVTEDDILKQVGDTVKKIAEIEENEKERLIDYNLIGVKDMCLRSLGTLERCAMLSGKEFLSQISNVKLGAQLGFIKIKDTAKIDELIVNMRPANINKLCGTTLAPEERDIYRAEYINSAVAKLLN